MTDLRIAKRPEVTANVEGVTLVAELTQAPGPHWRSSFLTTLKTRREVAVSLEENSIRLSWPTNAPKVDVDELLDAIDHAIEVANSPHGAAIAAVEAWRSANNENAPSTPVRDGSDAPMSGPALDSESQTLPLAQSPPGTQTGGAVLSWSLGLGVASIFLGGDFGLLPISTVVVSVIALSKLSRAQHPKIWKAWVGLVLGIAYSLSYLYNYGYIG